jgi:hypothetical protein
MKKCRVCKTEIHPLEVFPGPKCLGCYEREMEGKTPQELYEEVMEGFGRGGVFK